MWLNTCFNRPLLFGHHDWGSSTAVRFWRGVLVWGVGFICSAPLGLWHCSGAGTRAGAEYRFWPWALRFRAFSPECRVAESVVVYRRTVISPLTLALSPKRLHLGERGLFSLFVTTSCADDDSTRGYLPSSLPGLDADAFFWAELLVWALGFICMGAAGLIESPLQGSWNLGATVSLGLRQYASP